MTEIKWKYQVGDKGTYKASPNNHKVEIIGLCAAGKSMADILIAAGIVKLPNERQILNHSKCNRYILKVYRPKSISIMAPSIGMFERDFQLETTEDTDETQKE